MALFITMHGLVHHHAWLAWALFGLNLILNSFLSPVLGKTDGNICKNNSRASIVIDCASS